MTPSDILTIPEAARFLRVSPTTLRKLIKQEALPVFRIGVLVRVRRTELLRWTEDRGGWYTPTVEARLLAVADGKAGSAENCRAEAERTMLL